MNSFYAAAIVLVILVVWSSFRDVWNRRKLPPGPYPLPIIGNIRQLMGGKIPRQETLANLSKTYGPLMCLRLGSLYTVVASSPEVAKQVLRVHDQALSDRAIISVMEANDYHKKSMGFIPVGDKWRKVRKISKEHLFSSHRLDESQSLRQEKLTQLREYIHECSVTGRAMNVGVTVFTTVFNLMTTILFSLDFAGYDTQDNVFGDFMENVEGYMECLTVTNIADFFPLLKLFDPQGLKRRSEFCLGKVFNKIQDVVQSRLESRARGSPKIYHDLLETLLNLMDHTDYNLSIDEITCLFVDLFRGATHTTAHTVEMAMTELLLNPAKMANATNELRTAIGENKQVEESDISRLPYLKAVIKETLRMHPVAPLLAPRKANSQVEIKGRTIPKNAMIFVNVWAIGRDSSIWPNPTSFEPERFFNNNINYNGQDFEYLPFGSGRRICPGLPLADRMLPLVVASLIHEFDWKLQPGTKSDDSAATHAVPLMATPIKI